MATAFIGLGANLGNTDQTLNAAIRAIKALPDTLLLAKSSYYVTAPVGAKGPDYTNAVIKISTSLSPLQLLDFLQNIECQHGRERPYVNAPRTLDLDILLYDQQIIDSARLTLPHPRMHERAFVLKPLAEIEPLLQLPFNKPVAELLEQVKAQELRLK